MKQSSYDHAKLIKHMIYHFMSNQIPPSLLERFYQILSVKGGTTVNIDVFPELFNTQTLVAGAYMSNVSPETKKTKEYRYNVSATEKVLNETILACNKELDPKFRAFLTDVPREEAEYEKAVYEKGHRVTVEHIRGCYTENNKTIYSMKCSFDQ